MRGGRPPSLDAALPCGFRFNPTDVELIDHYLRKWVKDDPLSCSDAVVFAEVYSTEPWNLVGEDEEVGYFFSHRTHHRQKSNYMNRRAGSGTWYPERKNPVIEEINGRVIGYKKMLCFCHTEEDSGRPNRKRKKSTGWVMYEYELTAGTTHQHIEPVLCLIKKSAQAISSSKKKQRDQIPSLGHHAEVSGTTLPTSTADIDAANYTNMVCSSTALITSEDCNTGYQIPMPVSILAPRPATSAAAIDAADFTARTSLAGRDECRTECGMMMSALPPLSSMKPEPALPLESYADHELFEPSLLPLTPYGVYDIEAAESLEAFLNTTLLEDLDQKGNIIENSLEHTMSGGAVGNTGGSCWVPAGSETGDQQLNNVGSTPSAIDTFGFYAWKDSPDRSD